jgi:hypothetical protein
MGLIVSLGNDKTILGEMTGEVVGAIAEMVTDANKLNAFDPSWGAMGAALATAAEDDKPEYAVVRVEEGWSGSRRLWTGRELESIVSQTNTLQPVGHLGHIPDDQACFSDALSRRQRGSAAITKTEPSKQKARLGEMVKVAYFAGYNLPGAKIGRTSRARAVRGISWWGKAIRLSFPARAYRSRAFKLKALDWARKGGGHAYVKRRCNRQGDGG